MLLQDSIWESFITFAIFSIISEFHLWIFPKKKWDRFGTFAFQYSARQILKWSPLIYQHPVPLIFLPPLFFQHNLQMLLCSMFTLPGWYSDTPFVLFMYFGENKATCPLCEIYIVNGLAVSHSWKHMDYHKDYHFSFVYFMVSTLAQQSDWLSLRVSCACHCVLLMQRTKHWG